MKIVLATLNAKYAHASLALRYLYANMGDLRAETAIEEFVIGQRPVDIVESLLVHEPRIVGLGVYIWNATQTLEVVQLLERVAPEIIIVLGGPEISHETQEQTLFEHADYVICGEADVAFGDLCRRIFAGQRPLAGKIVQAEPPDVTQLESPYPYFTDHDLAARVLYVEASRGCPFSCEFCLSSLDKKVRQFPLEAFLGDLQTLIGRGATQFKFIDRTFNLNLSVSGAILDFFLAQSRDDLFAHFEMIPDRFPPALRERVQKFAPGAIQFEVGIQTFDPETADRINRKNYPDKIADNLRFLRHETGVHIHADLILGLPGETVESMARGFDTLHAIGPHEIQVGILKRLRGTPIARHTDDWGMVYAPFPPYEILSSRLVDFATMQRLKRFARAWDLVANRGNFLTTLPALLAGDSAFFAFLAFSEWLRDQVGEFTGIALPRLAECVFVYLTAHKGMDPHQVAVWLVDDFCRPGRRPPPFLEPHVPEAFVRPERTRAATGKPRQARQARHLAHAAEAE